jgi:hypothetical protein
MYVQRVKENEAMCSQILFLRENTVTLKSQVSFMTEWKYLFGDVGIDGKIVLKWILKKQVVRMCTGLSWLRMGCSSGLV